MVREGTGGVGRDGRGREGTGGSGGTGGDWSVKGTLVSAIRVAALSLVTLHNLLITCYVTF